MSEIVTKDYEVIAERNLSTIETEIKTIEDQVYKTTLAGVIEISKRLLEAKELLEHGQWGEWCENNLGYSQRQAQRYIEIGQAYGDENSPFSNATMSSHLSISKAYSLLQVPAEEVENFVESNDIESMTVKELEEQIKQFKSEKEDIEKQYQDAISTIEELKAASESSQNTEELEKEIEKAQKKAERLQKKIDSAAIEQEKAVNAAKEEQIKEFENKKSQMDEELAEYKAEIKRLQEKLEKNGDTAKVSFKLHVEQMQKAFMGTLKDIADVEMEDSHQAEKMKSALATVIDQLKESI